jgi:hypothetical protein
MDTANHASHNNSSSMIEYPAILHTLKNDMPSEIQSVAIIAALNVPTIFCTSDSLGLYHF